MFLTLSLNNANCLFLSIVPEEQTVSVLICFFVLLTALSCFVNEFSWQPRFILLKNLIFSDLVQTATFGPAVVHSLIQRRTMAFSGWCYVQYFLGGVSVFCSLVTITCMALERYIYVCHAIHYLPIFTKIRLRGVLGGIWLYSVFIGVSEIVLLHTGRGEDDETVTTGLLCEPDVVEQHLGFPRASAVFRKTVGSLTLLLFEGHPLFKVAAVLSEIFCALCGQSAGWWQHQSISASPLQTLFFRSARKLSRGSIFVPCFPFFEAYKQLQIEF
uniref:G-protein coupled receptors family 1 profile domain-containing protein n=1 Tax=Maylandia zebra TaxID=106582 RepID=A0A3P9D5L9_9CICH